MAKRATQTSVKTPVAEAVEVERKTSPFERLSAAFDEFLVETDAPSWKRQLISFVLGVVAYSSTLASGIVLINSLTSIMLAATASEFLALIVAFFTAVIVSIAAVTAGYRMYEFAMSFEYSRIEQRISGWFKRGNKEISHA